MFKLPTNVFKICICRVYQTPNTSWSVYVSFQIQYNLSLDSPYLLPCYFFVFAVKLIRLSIFCLRRFWGDVDDWMQHKKWPMHSHSKSASTDHGLLQNVTLVWMPILSLMNSCDPVKCSMTMAGRFHQDFTQWNGSRTNVRSDIVIHV